MILILQKKKKKIDWKEHLFAQKKCSIWQIFLFLQNFKGKNWFLQCKIYFKWFILASFSKIFCEITQKPHFWPSKWLFQHFLVSFISFLAWTCHFNHNIIFINFNLKSVSRLVKKHVVAIMAVFLVLIAKCRIYKSGFVSSRPNFVRCKDSF